MWALRRFNCPESFTDPLAIYESARKRGMDFVTVSDHNSLDGSLAIAHLPGTFLSAEMTTYLPDDGCKLHVVVLDVPEARFPDIQDARHNVYELVDYLRAHGILHFLAHPLFDINRKLNVATLEKAMLLFEAIEVRNGARSARYNRFTEAMVRSLTPDLIDEMAERQGIAPRGDEPWRKAIVGGSDDHSGLFVTSAHTVADCNGTLAGFLAAIRARRTAPGGDDGDSLTLAHSIYAIGVRFFTEGFGGRVTRPPSARGDGARRNDARNGGARGGGERRNGARDGGAPGVRARRSSTPFLLQAIQKHFDPDKKLGVADKTRLIIRRLLPENVRRDPRTFEEMLEREAWRLIKDREFLETLRPASLNRRIFAVTARLVDRLIYEYTKRLFDLRLDRGLAGIVEPLSTIGLVHLLTAPYYIAFHNQTRNRDLMRELETVFPVAGPVRAPKIALFTDTLDEVNGVALTLRRLKQVAKARGVELVIITCTDEPTACDDGTMNFRSVGDVQIPEYSELSLRFPPVLDVLDYIDREGFTHVHVSTPGTVGLLGLAAAKLMDLPVAGSYHTDLPQYVRHLTEDEGLEDIAWALMIWFHSQLDELLVPSAATMDQLAAHGLRREVMRPMPRWVDTQRFAPGLRTPSIWPEMGVLGNVRLLYAGRVSREKDLPLLVDVFKQLVECGHDISLVVAGDGPWREAMQEALFGYPAAFLGFVPQDELARVYASADVFVFPSATDTFGNVVLEAQACGLPVLVSDQGGPQELVQAGVTGLVLPAHDRRAWLAGIEPLLGDDAHRTQMGAAAREFVLSRAPAMEEHFSTLLFPGSHASDHAASHTVGHTAPHQSPADPAASHTAGEACAPSAYPATSPAGQSADPASLPAAGPGSLPAADPAASPAGPTPAPA